jgi:hypothetical protein
VVETDVSVTDIELERLKMYQDSFKHMTTFSSGAILLASVVTGALFLPEPDSKLLVGPMLAISIFLLALGVLAAMWGLGMVPRHIDRAIDGSTVPPHSLRLFLWLSMVSAYFGLAAFAYFALLNLMPNLIPSIPSIFGD